MGAVISGLGQFRLWLLQCLHLLQKLLHLGTWHLALPLKHGCFCWLWKSTAKFAKRQLFVKMTLTLKPSVGCARWLRETNEFHACLWPPERGGVPSWQDAQVASDNWKKCNIQLSIQNSCMEGRLLSDSALPSAALNMISGYILKWKKLRSSTSKGPLLSLKIFSHGVDESHPSA